MGSRQTSPAFDAALDDDVIYPALLAVIEFNSGFLYLWTGYGDLVYDGNTYTGTGDLGGVSAIEETQDVEARGIRLTLTGLNPSILSLVLSQARQGKQVRVHLGLFNSSGAIIDVADDIFRGLTDVPSIQKTADDSAAIEMSAENRLIELRKSKVRRYTDQDQQELFAGDVGLQFVAGLQDKQINWGRNDNTNKSSEN